MIFISLVSVSLEGWCHKTNEATGKASNWQEVTLAIEPQVNLSNCLTVFTLEKVMLAISRPLGRVGGWGNMAKYVRQNLVQR